MRKNSSVAINDSVRPAWDIVRGAIPKGPSGLYASIKMDRATIPKSEASIHSNHPLTELVEDKTDPHEIRPRGSVSDMVAGTAHQALKFKIGGQVLIRRKVNHPGTKGKHSWKAGYEFVETVLQTSIQMAIEAAIMGNEYSSGPKVHGAAGTPIPISR